MKLAYWLALACVIAPACSSGLTKTPPTDAQDSCGCSVDSVHLLHMSFDCYCRLLLPKLAGNRSCTDEPALTCQSQGIGSRSTGCGLTSYTAQTIGGPESWVYDATGNPVGVHISSDDAEFYCPSNPSLFGYAVTAGQLLDDSCAAVQTCPCGTGADGGVSCAPPHGDAAAD